MVPLLKGVDHVARLRERYGPEQVLPGTTRVEAERIEPGRVRQLSPFANAEVTPSLPTLTRAEKLCGELGAAGLSCEVQDDEVTMLWSKLCFLAPFALATTASVGTLGAVRSDTSWHFRLEAYVTEACFVAITEGAKLTPQPILAALEGAPDALRIDAKGRGRGTESGARCHRGPPSFEVATSTGSTYSPLGPSRTKSRELYRRQTRGWKPGCSSPPRWLGSCQACRGVFGADGGRLFATAGAVRR